MGIGRRDDLILFNGGAWCERSLKLKNWKWVISWLMRPKKITPHSYFRFGSAVIEHYRIKNYVNFSIVLPKINMFNFQFTIERLQEIKILQANKHPHIYFFKKTLNFPNESILLFQLWATLAFAFAGLKILPEFAAMNCGYRDHCAIFDKPLSSRRILKPWWNEWIKCYENRGIATLPVATLKKQQIHRNDWTGWKAFEADSHPA